jgi:hypothetical protein
MTMEPTNRSIPDIIMHLVRQLTELIRSEGQLARAELSEKVDKFAAGGIVLGAGAVLLLPAIVILLEAAVAALVEAGWSTGLAALIVGVVALAIGGVLCAIGIQRLRAVSIVPQKTIRQIQQDVAVATETRYDHDVERAA